MDKSPPPLSLAAARALPLPEGRRSSEVFVDGDLEVRFYAPKGHDPQPPTTATSSISSRRGAGSSGSATGSIRSRRARCSTSPRMRFTASRIFRTISRYGSCSTAR